jgi:hypothetical protein
VRRLAALLGAAVLALAGGDARADSWSATLEPSYGHVETDTEVNGVRSSEVADQLRQRYQLTLELNLTEFLTASAGASILDRREWRVADGHTLETDTDTKSFYGRLMLGSPTMNGGLGVDRTEHDSPGIPASVTESYTGYLLWRPVQLPELELRASHVDNFDTSRRLRDTTTDTAAAGLRYEGPNYDVRYRLTWTDAEDHRSASESSTVQQDLLGTRSDRFFGDRTNTYLNAALQARSTSNTAHSATATVSRQQPPVAGFSAIEAAPATPEDIELSPNPLLIDNNLASSAGVNVGYAPTLAGDLDRRAPRDVGARFGDLVTNVNTIYVWFDRPLTASVGAALASTVEVYESDDNLRWTNVAPSPAFPSPFESRIEVAIPQKAARFLKVVLRPLEVGVTTDTAYSDVFVTEVQFFLVVAASTLPRHDSSASATATGFARTLILPSWEFAHDITLSLAHDTDSDLTRYSLVNGLSFMRPVWRTVTSNARVERQDADLGRGHEAFWRWSAGLIGRPLATAYWSLLYSGNERSVKDEGGDGASALQVAHSLTALGRADLYDGISAQASGSVSQATTGTRTGQSGQASGSLSMTPNRWMTVTGGGLFSRTRTTDSADGSAVVTQYARVDGSLSVTPAPALSAAGTVSRVILGVKPTTLGTLQLNYFPLRGDLQLSVGYTKTLDTAAEATTEMLTPTLRWNVRRGVSLTTTYSLLKNVAPVQTLTTRALLVTLLITL